MGIVDAEIKIPSAENPKLSKAPSFQPGVGQNIALHALHADKTSSFYNPPLG